MPIDAAFAQIEKCKLRAEKISSVDEWLGIIKDARIRKPFKICGVNFPPFSDLQERPEVEVVLGFLWIRNEYTELPGRSGTDWLLFTLRLAPYVC